MTAVLRYLLRKFYLLSAIALITLAVLVQAGRSFFPLLEDYREEFVDYLGTQLNAGHILQVENPKNLVDVLDRHATGPLTGYDDQDGDAVLLVRAGRLGGTSLRRRTGHHGDEHLRHGAGGTERCYHVTAVRNHPATERGKPCAGVVGAVPNWTPFDTVHLRSRTKPTGSLARCEAQG